MKVGIDTFGCGHGKTGLGSYLDDDVTEKPGQSMSAYWMVTRELIHGLD